MHHEALAVFALQRIDDLLVARGTESRSNESLRLTAREQRGAVGARQNTGPDADRAHRAGIAAVDTRLAVENLIAARSWLPDRRIRHRARSAGQGVAPLIPALK
jgi:hypothetical protein